MGLMSWLFPSKDDRLARARKALDEGRFAIARDEARDLGDHPGASSLIAEAERKLALRNLELVHEWAEQGDLERAAHHLDVAADLCPPELDREFERAERALGASTARVTAEKRAAAKAEAAKLLELNPSWRQGREEEELPLPPGVTEEDADAMRARLAILVEGYPEALRPAFIKLGSVFAGAVVDLEDGKLGEAAAALATLPDDEPLVRHERARLAMAMGNPTTAAAEWQAFASFAGGHHPIGSGHSATMLAHARAVSGDPHGALTLLTEHGLTGVQAAGTLYPVLLEATGRYAEADEAVRAILSRAGPQAPLYLLLARIRERGGDRLGAMRALETSLEKCACGTGGCSKPAEPDVATYRSLATLYLEDGLETPRALELAETARSMTDQPVWEDVYLAALAARHRQDADWPDLAGRLRAITAAGDPRAARLDRHLAVA